jgi:hypothetical protein
MTRGNKITSQQMRGKQEWRCCHYQNTTQQSNGTKAPAGMRCWWIQGGFDLARGKWEVKAPALGEVLAHQEVAVDASRDGAVQQEVMLQPARENKRAV